MPKIKKVWAKGLATLVASEGLPPPNTPAGGLDAGTEDSSACLKRIQTANIGKLRKGGWAAQKDR